MTTWRAHNYLFWPLLLGAGIALVIDRFGMRDDANARNWRPDVLIGGLAVLLVLFAQLNLLQG